MQSWALKVVSPVKIRQEVEYRLCERPIFEKVRKTQGRRQRENQDGVRNAEGRNGM
jgi:hypothetical protein